MKEQIEVTLVVEGHTYATARAKALNELSAFFGESISSLDDFKIEAEQRHAVLPWTVTVSSTAVRRVEQ